MFEPLDKLSNIKKTCSATVTAFALEVIANVIYFFPLFF